MPVCYSSLAFLDIYRRFCFFWFVFICFSLTVNRAKIKRPPKISVLQYTVSLPAIDGTVSHAFAATITKTCLFKYAENFTTKK